LKMGGRKGVRHFIEGSREREKGEKRPPLKTVEIAKVLDRNEGAKLKREKSHAQSVFERIFSGNALFQKGEASHALSGEEERIVTS